MEKIAVVVDSTTDLLENELKEWNVHVVPMQIIYNDGRTFRDGLDINVSQVSRDLDEFEPKTSLPVMSDAVGVLTHLIDEGYTHCIIVPLSSGISGTYNMFLRAAELFEGKLTINVIDCKSVSMGLGIIVRDIVQKINSGASYAEIVEYANQANNHQKIIFGIETLKYLQRGGRISKVEGTVGSVLDIKPIIEVDDEGKLTSVAKVRGRKKSIIKVAQLFKEEADRQVSKGKKIRGMEVIHGNRPEDGEFLVKKLTELFPEFEGKIQSRYLGALLTCHTGDGTIGGGIYWED